MKQQSASKEQILKQLEEFHSRDSNWKDGRTWSLVYHAGDEHTEFLKKAYSIYFHQNGLNPGAFPSLQKFESEVVSTTAELFHGREEGRDAQGTMTSGGSESIMMAVKTYRDWARVQYPQIREPEMIVPQSIHPAFDKAAHYFSVKLRKAPLTEAFTVDLEAVRKLLNPSTILLVGSAPAYPQGVMDPIHELAELAQSRKIGMHVDACLGGFFLPFLEKLGEKIPPFDFRLPGVTSISADLHKYGFSAKGASVILYRDSQLRKHQFFVSADWPGGCFASPSMTGTRPAGSIAAAWAAIQAMGWDGYLKLHREILETTRTLQAKIQAGGFMILGNPVGPVFSFKHEKLNIFAIADQLEEKGWHIDRQQNPNSIHVMVTPAHKSAIPVFIKDLQESAAFVEQHPELAQSGKAAMYGMAAEQPEGPMIREFLYQYMESRYRDPSHDS